MTAPRHAFDRASEFLARKLQQSYSTPVAYKHGEDIYVVLATPCRIPADQLDEGDMQVKLHRMDFIFQTVDLPITPTEGDTVEYLNQLWEVSNRPYEGTFRFSDTSETLKRVYTTRIGER